MSYDLLGSKRTFQESVIDVVQDLDTSTLDKVNDFVDDDLLSCFLWAAGENAVAQPGWESPSTNPLKGIPLPPNMPPLPSAAEASGDMKPSKGSTAPLSHSNSVLGGSGLSRAELGLSEIKHERFSGLETGRLMGGGSDLNSDDGELDAIRDLDEDDIADIGKLSAPLSKEQKLSMRMQRKAESARVARLRKKEYVSGLEDQVASANNQVKALQIELKAMRAEAAAASAAGGAAAAASVGGPAIQEPRSNTEGQRLQVQRQLSHMDELLRQPSLDRLVPEVNATVEKYVANKRAQQETINDYLDCIEDFLSPTAPLEVAFNATPTPSADPALSSLSPASSSSLTLSTQTLATGENFFLTAGVPPPAAATAGASASAASGGTAGGASVKIENGAAAAEETKLESGEPPSKRMRRETVGSQLLGKLTNELGLTKPQVDALSGQKEFIRNDREIIMACLGHIKDLRGKIAEHIKASQNITDGLRRILTPVQVAKFLMWVERNQRAMDSLNAMLAET